MLKFKTEPPKMHGELNAAYEGTPQTSRADLKRDEQAANAQQSAIVEVLQNDEEHFRSETLSMPPPSTRTTPSVRHDTLPPNSPFFEKCSL